MLCPEGGASPGGLGVGGGDTSLMPPSLGSPLSSRCPHQEGCPCVPLSEGPGSPELSVCEQGP